MGPRGMGLEKIGSIESQGFFDYETKRDYKIGLRDAGHQAPMDSWLQQQGVKEPYSFQDCGIPRSSG